jgi:alpha-L-rhamnosidase
MPLPLWHAAMITPNEDFDGAPLLRKEFTLAEGHGAVAKATLRATAFGVYEAFINGFPWATMSSARAGAPTNGASATAVMM